MDFATALLALALVYGVYAIGTAIIAFSVKPPWLIQIEAMEREFARPIEFAQAECEQTQARAAEALRQVRAAYAAYSHNTEE
jgi:hypothetical protein